MVGYEARRREGGGGVRLAPKGYINTAGLGSDLEFNHSNGFISITICGCSVIIYDDQPSYLISIKLIHLSRPAGTCVDLLQDIT